MAKIEGGKVPGILDDPESTIDETLSRSEEFVRKNGKLLSIVFGVAILAVAGYFGYKFYIGQQEGEAQAEMFNSVYYLESDSLKKALNGDGRNPGFLGISEDYSGTKAANLSNYEIGVIYLKQGKFEDAIEYLKKFSSNDLLLQARAYSLIGDANLESKDIDGAIEYYKKAANYHPNEFFTPRYLMKLAMAYELNKDFSSAVEQYDVIINKYFKSAEANDAKKYKAYAEEKSK